MSIKAMASIMFLIALLGPFLVAQSLPQPPSPDCEVASGLSSCRGYLVGSAPKPSGFCCDRLARAVQSSCPRCLCRALRGGASIPVNKYQARDLADACKLQPHALGSCFDGSGMTESPTESPKEMPESSTRSLHTDSLCPDCQEGSIDPGQLMPIPPRKP